MKSRFLKQVIFLGLFCGIAATGQLRSNAYGLTLADLLVPAASITVGDKIFFNFSNYSSVGTSGSVPASNVFVSPQFLGGEIGLRFQPLGMSVFGADILDIAFNFDVKTASGQALIIDDDLRVTGGATGHGQFNIAEAISDNGPLNNLFVFGTEDFAFNQDSDTFAPESLLHIAKDIAVSAVGYNCSPTCNSNIDHAFISDFSQLFSQTPEPGSLLLLGAGLVGLAARFRKSVKK